MYMYRLADARSKVLIVLVGAGPGQDKPHFYSVTKGREYTKLVRNACVWRNAPLCNDDGLLNLPI